MKLNLLRVLNDNLYREIMYILYIYSTLFASWLMSIVANADISLNKSLEHLVTDDQKKVSRTVDQQIISDEANYTISPCDYNPCDSWTTECITIDETNFYCNCLDGYKLQPGRKKQTNKEKCWEISPCDSEPCDYRTTNCIKVDANNFFCDCKVGYKLQPGREEKTNKDKCLGTSCETLQCDIMSTRCIKVNETNFYCKCEDGYKLQPGREETTNKEKCLPISPCYSYPCESWTTQCIDVNESGFYCKCRDGYKLKPGREEKTNKEKCLVMSACQDSGGNVACESLNDNRICVEDASKNQMYRCDCRQGFKEIYGKCIGICNVNTCIHGHCEIHGNIFKCKCDEGYIGKFCDTRIIAIPVQENKLWIILGSISVVTLAVIILGLTCCVLLKKNEKQII